ncbi:hypothetical protein [Paraburkholderia azotifigens]|uniref:hypothetical protein n=1 Tax=Paraburkholderia azotifigens TaxID=2057004 RepID=UPI0038BB3B36
MTIRPRSEAQIAIKGSPHELDQIGEHSALTRPGCSGARSRLRDDPAFAITLPYRRAFSALSLDEAGAQNAEDAIWDALRAVQETMMFARERQQWACPVGSEDEIALEFVARSVDRHPDVHRASRSAQLVVGGASCGCWQVIR